MYHCTSHYLPVGGASPHHSRSLYKVCGFFPFENFPIQEKRNKISALSLIHTRRQIRTLCGVNLLLRKPRNTDVKKLCVLTGALFNSNCRLLSFSARPLVPIFSSSSAARHFPSLNEVSRCCKAALLLNDCQPTHPVRCLRIVLVDIKLNKGTHHQKYRTRSSRRINWGVCHTKKIILKWLCSCTGCC